MPAPAPELLLYYHPHSFYSQKVVMALYEKQIPFHARYVNILNGKQFTEDFLSLNPRGEVPVLVDDNIRHIPDSTHIIDYLEDNFSNGSPRLRPEDQYLRNRCDQLNQQLNNLKVEYLSFGSAVHSVRDLGINPKPPYCYEGERAKVREVVDHRKRILRTQAVRFPQHADVLNAKLKEVEHDLPIILNRDQYEGLILQFEKVLDECEAELSSHRNHDDWLITDTITMADISLSILLYRLWLLGFEKRMWERGRPAVKRYFERIRKVESFKLATSMSDGMDRFLEFIKNPVFLTLLATASVLGAGYYLYSHGLLGGIISGKDCSCKVTEYEPKPLSMEPPPVRVPRPPPKCGLP